ncbi:MAG: DUF6057 family protein [Bacteroidia bacterium]|nr:DUF6057 family protein [Bacteroidia bacterium]
MKETVNRTGKITAALAFLAAFGFFLIAYPYHLIRREQLNLFVFDWDYIAQRFTGIGWLSRLASSFLEQFFHSRVLGAIIIALLLAAIGTVTYRICRKFLGKSVSNVIAALMFIWTFLRECGNLYLTRYTVATLGFLALILLALQFKKPLVKAMAAVLFLCFGAWALGSPYDSTYGKLWGVPRINYDRMYALDAETAKENWDRVLKLSEKDLHMMEASVCYNLAQAAKGQLGNKLFDHSQSDPYNFILSVNGEQNFFTNSLAGEQWYQFGDMTIAEQSAITCLQASPEHTGARFIERLARVNIITGQTATAQKYLNILNGTVFYRKWARRMLDGAYTAEDKAWIERGRANMAVDDNIHLGNVPRTVLKGLLEVNPENTPAREYLLCYDLLRYDLEQFIEDYDPYKLNSRLYKEAVIINLGQQGVTSQRALDEYGIDDSYRQRQEMFFRYPENYRNTYWYYYLKALNESGR